MDFFLFSVSITGLIERIEYSKPKESFRQMKKRQLNVPPKRNIVSTLCLSEYRIVFIKKIKIRIECALHMLLSMFIFLLDIDIATCNFVHETVSLFSLSICLSYSALQLSQTNEHTIQKYLLLLISLSRCM